MDDAGNNDLEKALMYIRLMFNELAQIDDDHSPIMASTSSGCEW
jgi:hypothetical protein